jgi:hypothetical protein
MIRKKVNDSNVKKGYHIMLYVEKALRPLLKQNDVDRKFMTKIINAYLYNLTKEFITTGFFTMPFKLGALQIKKVERDFSSPDQLKLDYNHLKKTGEKIYHTNLETNNYYFAFFWRKHPLKIVYNGEDKFYSYVSAKSPRGSKGMMIQNIRTGNTSNYASSKHNGI